MTSKTEATTTWTGARLPWAIRLANHAAALKDRLGMPPAPLSARRLIDRARSRTGLDDLGRGDILEPLTVLAESFEHEAGLSPFGHMLARAFLLRAVERRLRIVDLLRTSPEILEQPIRRPLFVVGLPRTGTTMLFNLLAEDPTARPLLGWEAYHPISPVGPPVGPPVGVRTRRRDRRLAKHRRSLRQLDRLLPELQQMHPITAEGPEECLPLLLRSFVTWAWSFYAHLPSYNAWLWEQPRSVHEETYRFHREQLQLLQWQHGEGRWLLKSPAHLNGLTALLRVYPDACVVQTHRDLSKVLPSACSLFAVSRRLFSDRVEAGVLGRQAMEMGTRSVGHLLESRRGGETERILDVRYADLVADPLATVERIHAHFDLPVTAELRAGWARWIAENPRNRHGRHRYSLEQFDIARADVDREAAEYHAFFDIPHEA